MNNDEVLVPRWFIPAFRKMTVKEKVTEIAEDAGFAQNFNDLGDKPTTLDGYGITDATKEISLNGVRMDAQSGNIDLGMSSYNELIIGTHTEATNAMTGVSKLPSASYFVSGYRFTYWNPYNGTSTAATLTLTFQDNTSITVNLYYKGTTRLTTQMGAGSKIDFVYLVDANVGGTAYTGCWPDADYNVDNDTQRRLCSYYEKTLLYSSATPLYRYRLCGYYEGKIVPLTGTPNQTSATQKNKVPTTTPLDVSRGIVYYSTTTAVTTTNGAIPSGYLWNEVYSSYGAYSFNVTVPPYVDIYLQGSFDGKFFTLDNTQTSGNYRSYYVYAPKSADTIYNSAFTAGKYYWFVGCSYDTNNYYQLKNNNPVFYYDGTNLIQVYGGIVEARDSLIIPNTAPVSPQVGKTYLYYDETTHELCVRESNGTVYKTTLTT